MDSAKNRLQGLLAGAIEAGNIERIRDLIDRGADVNSKDHTGFFIMQHANNEAVLKVLVEKGADLNLPFEDNGATWLHYAAMHNLDEAAMLLRYRADPNARDHEGDTPLFWAGMANAVDRVALLIANGADVNGQGNDGWTALDHAIVGGNYEIAKLLLRMGAHVNGHDGKGDTPLILAANMDGVREYDFVGLLLQYGADVNAARPRDGMRPIHCAAYHGRGRLILRLAEAGAELNARTHNGMTAFDIALAQGHSSTAHLLAGAEKGTLKAPG